MVAKLIDAYPLIVGLIALIVLIAVEVRSRSTGSRRRDRKPYGKTNLNPGQELERQLCIELNREIVVYKRFLTNLYIPTSAGITTEVDVVMLSEYGVFVFECKDYSGYIRGRETDQNWTQVLFDVYRRKYTQTFYNPIKQNAGHISALKHSVAGFDNIPIYSVIVFGEKTKDINRDYVKYNDANCIVENINYIKTATDWIVQRKSNGDTLARHEIDQLYEVLLPFSQVSDETKTRHIERLREQYKD